MEYFNKIKSEGIVADYRKADLSVKAFITFSIGLMLSPLSYSLFWFLVFLVGFEIIYATFAGFDFQTRVVMITASVTGWVLGRIIVNLDPLDEASKMIGG